MPSSGLERTLTLQQSVVTVKVDNLSKATQSGIKSRFASAADLVLQIASTYRHGRLKTYIRRAIQAPKLLIIDELGYLPFCREEATLLPGYRSPIASTGSVIITSNLLGMKYGSFQFE
jgi:DNA replication protein DnaC